MKREFSAGGVVYRKGKGGKVEWLMRLPKANPEYRGKIGWCLPKGWIDEGEKAEEAAVREVREEGGVVAKIVDKLETIKIFFTDPKGEKVMKFITYFVMEYVGEADEGYDEETEKVRWGSLEEVVEMLAYKSEKELVRKAYAKT